MQRIKPSVVLAAAAVAGIALYASAYVEQTGSRMAVAAKRFLDSLPQGQPRIPRCGAGPSDPDREELVQALDGNQKKTAIVSPRPRMRRPPVFVSTWAR